MANNKAIKLGVVMDAIASIHFAKDTTLAFLLAAQARNWQIFYMEQSDLFIQDGIAYAKMRKLTVHNDAKHWFDFNGEITQELQQLDVILMRKDPPFNMQYIYTTYILELAEAQGTLVVNKPKSLRDANEKVFTSLFPQCTPKSLVTSDANLLREFINTENEVILKPLHGMGGSSIFRLTKHDPNINVVIETLTDNGTCYIIGQKFIPEITQGDKRLILIDGEPIPYGLARIPKPGDTRGNLAAGAKGVGIELTDRDYWICEQVGPTLRKMGLIFVGLDVIGDYLTEINVTSPTCVREIEHFFEIDIAGKFLDCIVSKL